MSDEPHKTISLSEFTTRALEGETIEQELNDGTLMDVHVHAPDQATLINAQRLMVRIVQVADAARKETDISDDDATLAYELGLAVLSGCVRDENGEALLDQAVVKLFSMLPYRSTVMTRCQELCGVDMFTVPPVSNSVALKAMSEEAAEVAAQAEAQAKPNRKTRRAAAKGMGIGWRREFGRLRQMERAALEALSALPKGDGG